VGWGGVCRIYIWECSWGRSWPCVRVGRKNRCGLQRGRCLIQRSLLRASFYKRCLSPGVCWNSRLHQSVVWWRANGFTHASFPFENGILIVIMHDRGGWLQQISYGAREVNLAERGNTYTAYDLEALAVCEAFKQLRCCLEGCFKFLILSHHDTLRCLLMQPPSKLNK
jgi:hypothetical protein